MVRQISILTLCITFATARVAPLRSGLYGDGLPRMSPGLSQKLLNVHSHLYLDAVQGLMGAMAVKTAKQLTPTQRNHMGECARDAADVTAKAFCLAQAFDVIDKQTQILKDFGGLSTLDSRRERNAKERAYHPIGSSKFHWPKVYGYDSGKAATHRRNRRKRNSVPYEWFKLYRHGKETATSAINREGSYSPLQKYGYNGLQATKLVKRRHPLRDLNGLSHHVTVSRILMKQPAVKIPHPITATNKNTEQRHVLEKGGLLGSTEVSARDSDNSKVESKISKLLDTYNSIMKNDDRTIMEKVAKVLTKLVKDTDNRYSNSNFKGNYDKLMAIRGGAKKHVQRSLRRKNDALRRFKQPIIQYSRDLDIAPNDQFSNKMQQLARLAANHNSSSISFLSPRLLPLFPKNEDATSFLSPNVFSFFKDSKRNVASLPELFGWMNPNERESWIEFLAEITGAAKQLEDVVKEVETRGYPSPKAELDVANERMNQVWSSLSRSYTNEQQRELRDDGYTFLDRSQLEYLYGPQGYFSYADFDFDFDAYDTMSRPEKEAALRDSIRQIAGLRQSAAMRGWHRRQRDPTTLSPFAFSPGILSPGVLGPTTLSPSLFSPGILGPSALSPSTLSPSLGNPSILSPSVLNPSTLSPSVLNPSVLSPSALNPSVLSPGVLNPSVLSPSVLSPAILSPSVLSPAVLSPSVLGGGVLSPSVLSPGVLSPGVLNADVLSPSVLS